MRLRALCIVLLSASLGCQSKPAKPVSATVSTRPVTRHPAVAALAFDPPVISGETPIDLSRDSRTPSAYVGYDGLTTTYFYINSRDQMGIWGSGWGWGGDGYERWSNISKTGVRYR